MTKFEYNVCDWNIFLENGTTENKAGHPIRNPSTDYSVAGKLHALAGDSGWMLTAITHDGRAIFVRTIEP